MDDKRTGIRAVGVIAGRGGSNRLPSKNVMLIGGKPLIAHPIEAALQSRQLMRVIVSTDDEVISEVALQHGAEVIKRPSALARDNSPIDDAYRHVLHHIKEAGGDPPDIVVAMQANIPIRKENEIDEMVEKLGRTPWATSVATARRVAERPEWMKQLKDRASGEIAPFMDAGENFRKQDLPDLYLLDGAVIALRSEVLMRAAENRRVHAYLGDRILVQVHEARYSFEIDEPDDVEQIEWLLSRMEG